MPILNRNMLSLNTAEIVVHKIEDVHENQLRLPGNKQWSMTSPAIHTMTQNTWYNKLKDYLVGFVKTN